jgi:superfamily II DNA or RNA helicase
MTRTDLAADSGNPGSHLLRIVRGDLLGKLPRNVAEKAFRLYRERRIAHVRWTGDDVEGRLELPDVRVRIEDPGPGDELGCTCTECGSLDSLCHHAAATLMQWTDVRPTMIRLGPGSAWRSHSRHPFVAPSGTTEERIDLSHLTGPDLRSAIELQLSLQRTGTATAALRGDEVQIRITLPSDAHRTVAFKASLLPSALPLLRTMARVELQGELADLELSEVRLHPVLAAAWTDNGILLEPSYRVGSRSVLSASELQGRVYGRWAKVGRHLCLVLDPATPLVPFHRKGRQLLQGQDALRFLSLDHPQLQPHSWYLPQGALASFRQPVTPKPVRLQVHRDRRGTFVVLPAYEADGNTVEWPVILSLMEEGFVRFNGMILRAPGLDAFERAGLRLPARGRAKGLRGDRLALIRLIAESGLAIDTEDGTITELDAVLRGRVDALTEPPPGLRSTLRPYQSEGVAWLRQRHLAGIGALLADDMGLGKTHQVMGLLCFARRDNPDARILVVCPRGVLEHWYHLLQTYAPDLGVQLFHGPDRRLSAHSLSRRVVLTTYDILVRSVDELTDVSWDVAVFDEAQRIKNPRTKSARASRRVDAGFRIAMSGTPLENRLLELWSVVDLILPGYLGSERDFRALYRNPTQDQLTLLRKRLAVITLRRLKENVLTELPEKFEDIRYCGMSAGQRDLYEQVHQSAGRELVAQLGDQGLEVPYLHIFALLTRLKQICDHPALVDDTIRSTSGKTEVFDEVLDEALEAGRHIVVFSQYVQMINLLSDHLTAKGVNHLRLTGETSHRGRLVRRFNSGQHERVLLASLLAGGVGIDLTGASVVIHYDRWWNPAKENQATDRVHRMGQKGFVQVFKLVTRNTIEERIHDLIQHKVSLFEDVVAPTEAVVRGLDRRELAALLGYELPEAP